MPSDELRVACCALSLGTLQSLSCRTLRLHLPPNSLRLRLVHRLLPGPVGRLARLHLAGRTLRLRLACLAFRPRLGLRLLGLGTRLLDIATRTLQLRTEVEARTCASSYTHARGESEREIRGGE